MDTSEPPDRPPVLSVVIPTRNGLATLPRAVSSVLGLPFTNMEIIVVDDGSTDGTSEWVASVALSDHRVLQVRRDADHGVSAARNAGLAVARAPLVGFLDDDDIWLTEAVAARVSWMTSNPDVGMTFADWATLLPDGKVRPRELAWWPRYAKAIRGRVGMLRFDTDAFDLLYAENPVCTSTVIARREAVAKVGGFDVGLRQAEDWDLWIRLALDGPVAASTRREAWHSERPGSLSSRTDERLSAVRTVVDRYRSMAVRLAPEAALAAIQGIDWAESESARNRGDHVAALGGCWRAAVRQPLSYAAIRRLARASVAVACALVSTRRLGVTGFGTNACDPEKTAP